MTGETTPTDDRAALMQAEFAGLFNNTDRLRAQAGRQGRLFLDICAGGAVTRKRLGKAHGIRPGTVSALIQNLLDQGLIVEQRPRPPYQQGRPEVMLRPVFERIAVIVIHVISREIQAVLVDLAGRVLADQGLVVEVEQANNDSLLKLFGRLIAAMQDQAPAATEVIGIAFSLPGIVDDGALRWVYASRWPKMANLPLSDLVQSTGIPVAVGKALNGELRARLARRANERPGGTLVVHWGYGIGAAFALNAKIISTGNGGFGEIGHWIVAPKSRAQCHCGQYGCLETEAALWALLPNIREVFPQAPAEEWNFEAFLRDHDINQVPSLIQATDQMALTVRNLVMALFPHRLVLTGPFAQDHRISARFTAQLRT
ncbi:MAG: ROK family transcriptional regulator, partial [Alphaproteobacteria bacterium]